MAGAWRDMGVDRAAGRGIGAGATWALLAMLGLALRLPDLGNPIIDLDEQMYLLVGDRMWTGAIPYVDIWDRKPIGLFLIYALARSPGGDAYLGYQLLALAAAVATAGIIAALARRVASGAAGLAAGAVYLVWIELLGGRGGQAPIFYNGFVAAAALLTWLALERPASRWRLGSGAMLAVGLALQVKPTAVFEGAWFGLALLAGAWRAERRKGALAGYAAALVGIAIAPTLAAFAAYAAIGHADAWWFANVDSIFLRAVTPHEPVAGRLIGIALIAAAPLAVAMTALIRIAAPERWLLAGWLTVALAALLAIPPYYNHYALPLIVPVAVLAGVGIATSRALALLVSIAGVGLLALSGYPSPGATRDARSQVAAMAAVVDRYRGRGCPFVFQAPPVFYRATGSCLPTRYPFAPHLTFAGEANAIGVDPVVEVRRILAGRPPVIVSTAPAGDVNRRTYALVQSALAHDYVRVGTGLGYGIYARRRPVMPPRADNP